ncbi:hypothetical protein KJ365_07135 [Glaciecola sp. XM2]|uniref:hypothetical protein n=1 Tax=Glaciecola sp. XM2 TaxID=1914931 RepID=UPI001BDF21E5|nr:hypothetical protein [Glaciecola sp. XM2]MBT1450653.1 hypothetical protein [Glaciecola sp. XM2]
MGSRELPKKLREEMIEMTRDCFINLMKRLNLLVNQRFAYKVNTKRKHSDAVAVNSLNMSFNSVAPNQVRIGDMSYLTTGGSWLYSALVMDLYDCQ